MRWASIRNLDISNGENLGVSLFVQGCPGWGERHEHCKNCFNPETWDFHGGKEWTEEVENRFIELANKPYIKRISILGGEPLAEENLSGILDLVTKIRNQHLNKTIWLYTGYTWEDIFSDSKIIIDDITEKVYQHYETRKKIISLCDVIIDGRYVDSQRDVSLAYRGSSNQRVISVQQSLQQNKVVLHCD